MIYLTPNYALELSIVDYLNSQNTVSGSLLSGSNISYYTGIGNVTLNTGSIVKVDASQFTEVAPYTRNYEFSVNIEVFEMAADTTGSYLGVLAGAVFNEFVNTTTAAQNITNAGLGINVWNVREARMSPGFSGDALTNTINVTVVGAMVI